MMRYVAVATAIVVAAMLAILALGRTTPPRDAPFSSKLASPGVPRNEGAGSGTAAPLVGDAPWALSALPECFRQTFEESGSHAHPRIRAQDAPDIGSPTVWHRIVRATLTTADCRLRVAIDSAVVVRADTRLSIPPRTHVYVAGKSLVLDRFFDGGETIRAYRLVNGRVPAFTQR